MIRFIYKNCTYSKERENVITNIFVLAKQILNLPDQIEVQIEQLDDSIYAESITNTRFKNRIKLNDKLSLTELIKPIVHELIHLEQIHTGKLYADRYGNFVYHNKTYKNISPDKLSYEDYQNLPWENDVKSKEKHVLNHILDYGSKHV